jgi:spore maturation protein CgeB
MRIAVIGKFYPEAFGRHIAENFERMGHEVLRYAIGHRRNRLADRFGQVGTKAAATLHDQTDKIPAVRRRRFKRVLSELAAFAPLDLVLETKDFLWPEEVSEIKRRFGAAFAVWFPDAFVNLPRGMLLNAPIDAAFFKDPFMVHTLSQALPGRCYYLPECQNPPEHENTGQLADEDLQCYRCEITTVGNLHSYRVALFSQLSEFDVRIWGHRPPLWLSDSKAAAMYAGRPVCGQEKVQAFAGAKIVLNNLHFGEVWGVNVRTFEAAAAGAFQLVDWRPGLAQLFEDGKELVTFRGVDDLKQKIRRYLDDPEARKRVGAAALLRARRDHTYEQRLNLLLATIAGREHGYGIPRIEYA